MHNSIDFWTIIGTSTTIRGHNIADWGIGTPGVSGAKTTFRSLSLAPITDFEYAFGAINEVMGGSTLTGKYICWKLLGY
jgi:hypothetical protein